MKKYIIKEASSAQSLAEHVNEAMVDGYVPHGSMVAEYDPQYRSTYYQPMVQT